MNGSGTRSSLMYETVRIVDKLKPKYVIWENVKNLLSKKHRHNFDNYLERMENMGYRNYYQVLNAKDYGIPQNRERVFTISIRADIEKEFHFPEKEELKLRLKDMLEEQVDEKYYLSDKIIKFYKRNEEEQKAKGNGFTFGVSDGNKVARAITTRAGSRMDDNFIQQVGILDIKGQDCIKRVYSDNGLSPTLTDMQGGNRQPKIIASTQSHASVRYDGISPTLTTAMGLGGGQIPMIQEPKILIKNNTQQGYLEAHEGDGVYTNTSTKRGTVQPQMIHTISTIQDCGVVVAEPPKSRKNTKTMEKYCEYCGNKLERKRFNGVLEDFSVFKNRKYCNRECMKRAYLKIGENNQTYSNAHATARKINELILHKECCEVCGSTRNLDIHHIDGNWQNNNIDNLMCLCRSCHAKYEFNKNKIGDDEPMNDRLRIRKLTPKECWRL